MDNKVRSATPRVLFIGGTGRSGTNITKDILARHPRVASLPFEYRFIIDPDGIVDFYRSYAACWSPFYADRRLKRLETFLTSLSHEPLRHRALSAPTSLAGRRLSARPYHGWQLDKHLPGYSTAVCDLISELRSFSYPARWVGTESYARRPTLYHAGPMSRGELQPVLGRFILRVIENLLDAREKELYVEDNTFNILFARELLELVPKAKILHVYRDPRDVVASYTNQRWAPSDVRLAALWYKDIINYWFSLKGELPPESYLEIRLSSLVKSTEEVIEKVCAFAGLSCVPALFELPLGKGHIGRWKKDFTDEEKEIVHHLLRDELEALGFE